RTGLLDAGRVGISAMLGAATAGHQTEHHDCPHDVPHTSSLLLCMLQAVEGQIAGCFAAPRLLAGAQPGHHPTVVPARPLVRESDPDPGTGYFFFVQHVGLPRALIETTTQKRGSRAYLLDRLTRRTEAWHCTALQLNLAIAARNMDRDERDPVLGHGVHHPIAPCRRGFG